MPPLRAIIFDFDGVIADTEPAHYRAFARTLAEQGLSLSRDDYYQRYLGYDDDGVFRQAYREAGRRLADQQAAELLARKRDYYLRIIRDELRALPGVEQFVRWAARRWPLAICSGAIRREIDLVLKRMHLAECFCLIVSSELVGVSKPDPAGYRLTFARLSQQRRFEPPLEPAHCLVIEDSLPGIQAAQAAGMCTVAVATSHRPEQLRPAQAVVNSLAELDADLLARLFEPDSIGSTTNG
ncbi:MAG: HAD family hydrolase [Phycisphaerae bacterium]